MGDEVGWKESIWVVFVMLIIAGLAQYVSCSKEPNSTASPSSARISSSVTAAAVVATAEKQEPKKHRGEDDFQQGKVQEDVQEVEMATMVVSNPLQDEESS